MFDKLFFHFKEILRSLLQKIICRWTLVMPPVVEVAPYPGSNPPGNVRSPSQQFMLFLFSIFRLIRECAIDSSLNSSILHCSFSGSQHCTETLFHCLFHSPSFSSKHQYRSKMEFFCASSISTQGFIPLPLYFHSPPPGCLPLCFPKIGEFVFQAVSFSGI